VNGAGGQIKSIECENVADVPEIIKTRRLLHWYFRQSPSCWPMAALKLVEENKQLYFLTPIK
jgi:hypothetical protein